ncbi:hypothetical protein [Streptomyces afghaniensis]|uniref:hypothetical protein n=1 Tax=Streptomyces afghaniensis TaxID=66865 RepID=UPI0027812879|nr:hypothetical protein [Streptomyces afghaniensis]MDQ1018612.1 hypothetical protein [Streptomyces afghaniensis]
MTVLLSVALLVLTVAVALLFAMMGELSSRVPDPGEEKSVVPLPDATLGIAPADWPDALRAHMYRGRRVLLVLSPVCATCSKVGEELSHLATEELGDQYTLIVSSGSAEAGAEFVARHALQKIPHYVDEGGTWTIGSLGVNSSPAALVFEEGVLTDAYTFGTFRAIQEKVQTVTTGGLR